MKVKIESEVTQSCPTLSDPMDCSLPGSSVHGISQARVLEWVAIAFSWCMPWGVAKKLNKQHTLFCLCLCMFIHQCSHCRNGKFYSVTSMPLVLKSNKGKILAKRINVHTESIKHSQTWDSFPKHMKENDQKKKKAKNKGTWFTWSPCYSTQEAHFMRTSGKEAELLEPISWEFRRKMIPG